MKPIASAAEARDVLAAVTANMRAIVRANDVITPPVARDMEAELGRLEVWLRERSRVADDGPAA